MPFGQSEKLAKDMAVILGLQKTGFAVRFTSAVKRGIAQRLLSAAL